MYNYYYLYFVNRLKEIYYDIYFNIFYRFKKTYILM